MQPLLVVVRYHLRDHHEQAARAGGLLTSQSQLPAVSRGSSRQELHQPLPRDGLSQSFPLPDSRWTTSVGLKDIRHRAIAHVVRDVQRKLLDKTGSEVSEAEARARGHGVEGDTGLGGPAGKAVGDHVHIPPFLHEPPGEITGPALRTSSFWLKAMND
jgi:hypothetical protein